MFKRTISAAATALFLIASTSGVHAEGDPAKGKRVFNKCRACHSLKAGQTLTGPSLAGIMGKEAAQDPKYRYSKAMKESGWTWDSETMTTFLAKPKAALKGTKMTFIGLKKPAEIENLIAYLNEN